MTKKNLLYNFYQCSSHDFLLRFFLFDDPDFRDFFSGVGLLDELEESESDEDESVSELLDSPDDELDSVEESSLELLDELLLEYFRFRFRFEAEDFLGRSSSSSSELSSRFLRLDDLLFWVGF